MSNLAATHKKATDFSGLKNDILATCPHSAERAQQLQEALKKAALLSAVEKLDVLLWIFNASSAQSEVNQNARERIVALVKAQDNPTKRVSIDKIKAMLRDGGRSFQLIADIEQKPATAHTRGPWKKPSASAPAAPANL